MISFFIIFLISITLNMGVCYHKALGACAPPISGLDYFETELPTWTLSYKLVVAVDRKFVRAHRGAFRGGTCPVPPPEEDQRTPPKLPKLEYVALNSAFETGAKMHQKSKCTDLRVTFQNFSEGFTLRRPSPDPTPSALRRFAPTRLARGLRPLHRPPRTRNPASTPGRTHPFKILATPMVPLRPITL